MVIWAVVAGAVVTLAPLLWLRPAAGTPGLPAHVEALRSDGSRRRAHGSVLDALAREADLMIVAPASANTVAHLAHAVDAVKRGPAGEGER